MGSKSSSTQATSYSDQRVAVQDGLGISGDSNAVSINTTNTTNVMDGGIISRGLATVDSALSGGLTTVNNTVDRALDSIDVSNATNAQGFEKLLGAAESLWNKGEGLIGTTQKAVADAYGQAQSDKAGTIDNKTIIVLAVVGAAALAFSRRKG